MVFAIIFRLHNMRFMPIVWAFILICSVCLQAKESDAPPVRIPEIKGPVYQEIRSIPYPNRSLYISKGILGGIGFGKIQNTGESGSLFLWQGEMSYYYTPYFSAGLGGKITAGEPSDTTQKVLNRYFIQSRFHWDAEQFAIFFGQQIGLNNLNILSGTTDSIVTKPLKDADLGLGLGVDIGMGWKFCHYLGLTAGANLEYTTGVEELNLHISPGLAFDLLSIFNRMRDNVPAFYLSFEYQFGFLTFEKTNRKRENSFIAGLGVAF